MTSPAFDSNGIREFTPSAQQSVIFDWMTSKTGSALIIAVAGSGKTTTLVHLLRCIPETKTVAFTAYNKKIADEITERAKAMGAGSNVKCGTFHSFGNQAWARHIEKYLKPDEKKVQNILTAMKVEEDMISFIKQLVSLAKAHAIGVLTSFEDDAAWFNLVYHYDLDTLLTETLVGEDDMVIKGIALAKLALQESIKQARTTIDFDDMIYMPLVANVVMWQNDVVFIDEAQDTNPARRALAKKMLKAGGRLVAVGDPAQAIYGFTGADADALDLIRKEFGCIDLPLTVTYRCPKAVVRLAQTWVSHIEAAPSAPEGRVEVMTQASFNQLSKADLTADDVVLCRNTKPLVSLAYQLIRRSIGCHVEGRDIGRGLIALVSKWKVSNLGALQDKLEAYLAVESQKFLAKGQETRAEALADKVETLAVIMEQLDPESPVGALHAAINGLFGDTQPGQKSNNLTLSTVHKAKGREWDRVYLLGRNAYMPSKYARQDWQLVQERNLMYVAVTRAKKVLVEIVVARKEG